MKSLLLVTILLPLITNALPKATLIKFKEKAKDPIFLNETYSTGFVNIENRGDLFYWWFDSRNRPSKDPLIIWLTGGPGCSSELALFFENGPFNINKDLTLSVNPYSWNNIANVLYLDQPLGTGFSNFTDPSDIVINETGIAEDFFVFLNTFYDEFSEFEGRELFITGESYSGHYIPAIAAYLLANNKNHKIKFSGVAIGNGLVSAYWQYPQYAEFAIAHQLITDKQYGYVKLAFAACQALIDEGAPFAVYFIVCNAAMTYITGNPPRFNIYDISRPCIGRMCYDFSLVDDFLAQPRVIEAIGTGQNQWEECNFIVYQSLLKDWFVDQSPNVAYLLSKNMPVLIYSGDLDFICNWYGGREWTNRLDWAHKADFNNAPMENKTGFGLSKTVEGFSFYRIFDAGHMVPMDKPMAGLDMIRRFMKKGNLDDPQDEDKTVLVDRESDEDDEY